MRAGGEQSTAPWMTVVGVIRDAHRTEVTRDDSSGALHVIVASDATHADAAGADRRRSECDRRRRCGVSSRRIDPQLPLFNVTTLERELSLTLTQPRFQAVLLAVFAAIALLLATIGIYGVTSHAVSQRTQEVGIRMAMGAARRDVLRLIFIQHLRPALVGLALGLAGAFALSRSLQSLLFGVGATDPMTFTLVGVALLAVAAAACWIPARRATRVDPLVALRTE